MIAEFDKIKITWPNFNVEQGGVFSYMYLGEYGEFDGDERESRGGYVRKGWNGGRG